MLNIFSKILHRQTVADKRFWRAIGVLVILAAIGAVWMLSSALKQFLYK